MAEVVCTLARILKDRGLSRAEVARRAGIAPNTVGNLAKSHYSPAPIVSLITLSRVCSVLEIEPGDLLKLQSN